MSDPLSPRGSTKPSVTSKTIEEIMPTHVIRDIEGTTTRPTRDDLPDIHIIFEADNGVAIGAKIDLVRAAYETNGRRWAYYWIMSDGQHPEFTRCWERHPIATHPYHTTDALDDARRAIRNLVAVWGQQGPENYIKALLLAGFTDELMGVEPPEGLKHVEDGPNYYMLARERAARCLTIRAALDPEVEG